MTASLTSNLLPTVKHFVYTRRRATGAVPMINGEQDGWTLDENLICEQIEFRDGPQVGTARFRLEPRDATKFRIDYGLSAYHIDDQVRVMAYPPTGELVQQSPDQNGMVLFEGYLPRQMFSIVNNERQAEEGIALIAMAMPALDNQLTEHLITGRWMFDRKTATEAAGNEAFVSLSPSLPAVFNADGAPNMGQHKLARQIGATMISAPAFTHDADPSGRFWTVRAALGSILIRWLYKAQFRIDPAGTQHVVATATPDLNRNMCLDPELIAELAKAPDAAGTGDALRDLSATLPEVNVHGLGVLDAVKRVCDAAGFMFAVDLVQSLNAALGVDRKYQLRVWKRRRGRAVTIDLAAPNTSFADAASLFTANNVHSVAGLVSGEAVVNEVTAVGETFIEGRITLKPAWSPNDVDATAVTSQFQTMQDHLMAGTGYHAKHISGGALFAGYGQVGRVWMVDCVGDPFLDQGSNFEGYSSGIYKHDDEGFDFVTALGLNATGDNPLISERTALGFPGTIRWSNEPRKILPLRNAESQAAGIDWIVEVSEDGGSSWQTTPVKVTPLERQFGFKLLGIRNLASVNNASLKLGNPQCKVTESWWALIKNELLLFRITCAIRADHGAAAKAERQASSASSYKRGQIEVLRGVEEVWQQPGTLLNPTSGVWRKVRGQSVVGAGDGDGYSYRTMLSDYASQRQRSLEGRRLSANATLYLLEFFRYRLGDAVTKIAGREISFSVASGGAANYPNIVGISMTLSPPDGQGLRLVMEDHAMEGAV